MLKFTLEIFEKIFFWTLDFLQNQIFPSLISFSVFTNVICGIYCFKTGYFSFSWKKCHFKMDFIVYFAIKHFALKKMRITNCRPQLIPCIGNPPHFEENSKFKKKYFLEDFQCKFVEKIFFVGTFLKIKFYQNFLETSFFLYVRGFGI